MAERSGSWAEIVGRLPARLLTIAATPACLAFAALVGVTLDSAYRTHVPIKVAGYLFGYGADDPSDLDKLKAAIKLKPGISSADLVVTDPIPMVSNLNAAGATAKCPSGFKAIGFYCHAGGCCGKLQNAGIVSDVAADCGWIDTLSGFKATAQALCIRISDQ